ncbi:HAD-IA family hydrolase [Roseovarius sp.]|uniref:HAD-IA family hydrolase n=1 Tax=Roseovarius sp. TaxID=1486281 RepID=UPI003A979619
MSLIVFDIGNVLLRWEPQAAFRHAYDNDAEIEAVLAEVEFYDWNFEQDRGRPRAEAVAAIAARWPQHADLMDGYFDHFGLTIRERIQGAWDIIAELATRDHRLWALTNFSADTWPEALRLHPDLTDIFEGIVVSAHEGIVKPDREIFDLLCERAGAHPDQCYFTDDSAANVAGARAAGWQAHHFAGPEGLRADLYDRGLL